MTKKVGILGGTFDPIHVGHLLIAQEALDAFKLDRVILIPSGHSYFKDRRKLKVSGPLQRLEMTKLAAEGNPAFEVSDMEVKRPGNSYTCETMKELTARDPEIEYYYIIGADTVCSMHTWYKPEEIFSRCRILAAVRGDEVSESELTEGIERLENTYGAVIYRLRIPSIGISSTDIRDRVMCGRSIHYMVPDKVEKYIFDNSLYSINASEEE